MRTLLATLVAAGVLCSARRRAAPPEPPASFISVEELKKLIDGGAHADLIDVRHWEAFVEMHIKGARSIPVRSIRAACQRDLQDRARRLLLNLPARPGPGATQHPLYARLAQPSRARRRAPRLAREGLPGGRHGGVREPEALMGLPT